MWYCLPVLHVQKPISQTSFVPPPPYRSSRGVGSSDSVDTKYPALFALRSLVARRTQQQPKRLTTLVFPPQFSLRISTFVRKTRGFKRKIARIGISTLASGTPNPQRTSNGGERRPPQPISPTLLTPWDVKSRGGCGLFRSGQRRRGPIWMLASKTEYS